MSISVADEVESVTGYAPRMYERYSQVRPQCATPRDPSELVSGREPVFRTRFGPFLPVRSDAKILDLGCGYGEFLYFLQRRGYTSAMGVDLNRKQLEVAHALGVRNLLCCESRAFLRGTAGKFDFISAIDVLEHIPKNHVLQFLDAVFAALRPGGRFLCQVPNSAAFHTPLFYMDFSHETPFTAPSLKQILELANFVGVRVWPMGPVVHGPASAVRFLLWKLVTAGLRFIQIVEGGPRDPLGSIFSAAIFATADKPS